MNWNHCEPEKCKDKGEERCLTQKVSYISLRKGDTLVSQKVKNMSNNNSFASSFNSMNLGSGQPISVPLETIEVLISAENLLGDYARAFVKEAYRVNPLRAEQVGLTSEEVAKYSHYLLVQRVANIHDECSVFRKLKCLYIPVWIQYNLSMIGEVTIRDKGLRLVPVMEQTTPTLSFEEALAISEKIGMFEDDLQIVQDAMPRSNAGDKDVMSTALIAGYVRSLEKVEHVSSTYVTTFLGMKLKEEMAFKILYRVQYDDAAFIASAITTQRGLF